MTRSSNLNSRNTTSRSLARVGVLAAFALFATPFAAFAHTLTATHSHTITVHDHTPQARVHNISSRRRS